MEGLNLEGWVETDEALSITGVTRTTLYWYRTSGKIESQKIGRTVLYRRSDCEEVAREREAKKEKGGNGE